MASTFPIPANSGDGEDTDAVSSLALRISLPSNLFNPNPSRLHFPSASLSSELAPNGGSADAIAGHRQSAALAARRADEAAAVASSSVGVSGTVDTSSGAGTHTPVFLHRRKRRSITNGSVVADGDPNDASSPIDSVGPSPKKRQRLSTSLKKPPHSAKEGSKEGREDYNGIAAENELCTICMCEATCEEVSTVDGCSHKFCFNCIGKWADRENTCPLCKARFSKIKRIHQQRRKSKDEPSVRNVRHVKTRDQRSDLVTGAMLEVLFSNYRADRAGITPFLQQLQRGSDGAFASRSDANFPNFSFDSQFLIDNVFLESSPSRAAAPTSGSFFQGLGNLFNFRGSPTDQLTRHPLFGDATSLAQGQQPLPTLGMTSASASAPSSLVASSSAETEPRSLTCVVVLRSVRRNDEM